MTGQLIEDGTYRAQWLALVHALQVQAGPGGALEGWVFHATDVEAGDSIDLFGLQASFAVVNTDGTENLETEGCHFGTPNVAAFFAEALIESKEDPRLRFVIYGAPLSTLATCGELAADCQMLDAPLLSRYQRETDPVQAFLAAGQGWRASLDHLETVVVLADVPRRHLTAFREAGDVAQATAQMRRMAA